MPIPLLVVGAIVLCGLFLGGCSSPEKSETQDEDDSKDAIGEEETDTPPVEQAIVMCTCFSGGVSTSKIHAESDSEVTNGEKVLNNKNIEFTPLFTSCIITNNKKCLPDIENKEWQEYDETHTTGDDKYTLLKDRSFMFCTNGGMIYITEDGQKLKDIEELLTEAFLNNADTQTRKKYIWNYLTGMLGISEMHAAAIMGNIQQESNFSPTNAQDSYGYPGNSNPEYINSYVVNDGVGWGLLQWTYYTRKQDLYDFAKEKGKSTGDTVTQLEFFNYEVTNVSPYKSRYQTFLKLTDIEEATEYFCTEIEQAGTPHISTRTEYSKAILEEFGSN